MQVAVAYWVTNRGSSPIGGFNRLPARSADGALSVAAASGGA